MAFHLLVKTITSENKNDSITLKDFIDMSSNKEDEKEDTLLNNEMLNS